MSPRIASTCRTPAAAYEPIDGRAAGPGTGWHRSGGPWFAASCAGRSPRSRRWCARGWSRWPRRSPRRSPGPATPAPGRSARADALLLVLRRKELEREQRPARRASSSSTMVGWSRTREYQSLYRPLTNLNWLEPGGIRTLLTVDRATFSTLERPASPEFRAPDRRADSTAFLDRQASGWRRSARSWSPVSLAGPGSCSRAASGCGPAFCVGATWPPPGSRTNPSARLLEAAASLELLHVSALVHDDVMDSSDLRRGRPAAHRQFEASTRRGLARGLGSRYGRSGAILLG